MKNVLLAFRIVLSVLAVVVLLLIEIIQHGILTSLLLYEINLRVIIIKVESSVSILELSITADIIRVFFLTELVLRVTIHKFLVYFFLLLSYLWALLKYPIVIHLCPWVSSDLRELRLFWCGGS